MCFFCTMKLTILHCLDVVMVIAMYFLVDVKVLQNALEPYIKQMFLHLFTFPLLKIKSWLDASFAPRDDVASRRPKFNRHQGLGPIA